MQDIPACAFEACGFAILVHGYLHLHCLILLLLLLLA
jgi:hypothetical protein